MSQQAFSCCNIFSSRRHLNKNDCSPFLDVLLASKNSWGESRHFGFLRYRARFFRGEARLRAVQHNLAPFRANVDVCEISSVVSLSLSLFFFPYFLLVGLVLYQENWLTSPALANWSGHGGVVVPTDSVVYHLLSGPPAQFGFTGSQTFSGAT